jgi:hypothetical protein
VPRSGAIGNAAQEAALHKLLSNLAVVRNFTNVNCTTTVDPVKLHVMLNLRNFPIISIGRGGGFSMPLIRSYPEEKGAADSLTYPGKTAFDACLWGDQHVLKQGSGAYVPSTA